MIKRPFAVDILVVLAAGDNHGYGIYLQLIEDVQGDSIIYERAVYRELPRLIKASLVEVVDGASKPVKYRLTRHGRRMLGWERARLRQINRLLAERL